MMNQKLVILILFFCFFIGSCQRGAFQDTPSFRVDDSSDIKYNFDDVPEEDQCQNSDPCQRACGYIYQLTEERDRCLRKSIRDVERIYRTSEFLRDPIYINLRNITEAEFSLFLESGTDALNFYIEDYNISESRRFLRWMAEEREIAQLIFQLGSNSFRRIIVNLLRASTSAEITLHASLDAGKTFFRIANNRSNGWAIWMVHQVISEDLCAPLEYSYGIDPLSAPEACVLRVYCHYREGQHIHVGDFPYISRVIEYTNVFEYIRDDYPIGLSLNYNSLNKNICEAVCSSYPGSCSPSYRY